MLNYQRVSSKQWWENGNIVASTIPQISILGPCLGGWKMTLPWVDYKPGAGIWDDLYGYNHGILTTITWDISITPISMAIYHHFSSLELHPEVGFQAQARRKTPIGTWECVPVMCCNGHMYAYTYKQYIYAIICIQ